MKEQQIHHSEVVSIVFELIFRYIDALSIAGMLLLGADGQMRQCYPDICAWTADYYEKIH